MLLRKEQTDELEDYILGQPFLGDIVEYVQGEDGEVQRQFLAIPDFVRQWNNFPELPVQACVLRFDPYKGYTHIHYYLTMLDAYRDNAE